MKVPPDADRCIFEFNDGRRCRGWRRGNGIFLCHTHQKVHEREEQFRAELAANGGGEPQPPASIAAFANVLPGAATDLIAGLDAGARDSVANVRNLAEHVLLLVVNNSISARSANACTQLLRLLLKAQPQFEQECFNLNEAMGLFQPQPQPQPESETEASEEPLKKHATAAD